MTDTNLNQRLFATLALANDFCVCLENASSAEKPDFIAEVLNYLPRLYYEFSDLDVSESEDFAMAAYVDEDYYESVRRNIGNLLGEDDAYLETESDDMRYSEAPIAASIAEGLADIFQDLYNFVAAVRASQGDDIVPCFAACRENFIAYWSRTLCSVMRPLNRLRWE